MKRLIIALLTITMLAGCSSSHQEENTASTPTPASTEKVTITNKADITAFKADMSQYKWITEPYGDFEETTLKESIKMFTEKGSGILYFGYVGCPWCERAVPNLNKAAVKTGATIYYIDASVQPDNGDYKEITGYLASALDKDENGDPEFFVPLVVGVKNGEIVGSHTSLVDDFTLQSEDDQMSDAQNQELEDIYTKIIAKCAD